MRDVEPDLELEDWSVPSLRPAEDEGLRCPDCGGRLVFENFQRIRPPPLNHASRQPGIMPPASTEPEDVRQRNVTRF